MRFRRGKPLPTDLEILEAIYERYYDAFTAFERDTSIRALKIYVPIDIAAIAETLGVDADIVFGRLHYHLDKKYGHEAQDEDDADAPFFTVEIQGNRHCVNFPLVAAVLADLKWERNKFQVSTVVSGLSLLISLGAMCVSILLLILTALRGLR